MIRACHYCGQPLPAYRLGVRLTPMQGRIFDLICRAGGDGIDGRDLADIAGCSRDCVSVHVHEINNRLRDRRRDYHLRGYGTYRLIKLGKKS